jgi:putative addiction module component (TIGR02574 family)
MNAKLRELPIEERIQLVEDLWDSIAEDRKAFPVTLEQRAELDRRLIHATADCRSSGVRARARSRSPRLSCAIGLPWLAEAASACSIGGLGCGSMLAHPEKASAARAPNIVPNVTPDVLLDGAFTLPCRETGEHAG